MKVLNISESTVFLDDINVAVIYSRRNEPFDIPDRMAKKSQNLKFAIKMNMLLDVTNGMPATIPKGRTTIPEVPADPASPYFQKKAMLVEDDHGPKPKDTVLTIPIHNEVAAAAAANDLPKSKANQGPSALEIYKNTGVMNWVYSGPALDAGGFALMNRSFMFGLSESGVKVKYDLLPSLQDMDPETMKKLTALTGTIVPKDAPKIYGMTAPGHYSWERYKFLFTMMETRRLHKDYVERCNCADEIVVPSHWCKDVFLESGVKKPIEVVPLGVDLNTYRTDAEPIGFSKNLKPFIFLSVFGWSLRKGYDVMLKAYLEEFTSDDPVTFLISSRYFGSTDESKKKKIRSDIAEVSSMVSNPKKPQVILFGDVLPEEMMPRLYAAADCYVLISRGEGFSFSPLQAGACGIPVISSRYSGHLDFLDDENSWLVDVDGFRKVDTALSWISYFYEDAEFPIFGDKAVEQTRHFMRQAFENKEERERKANKLHERVISEYGWPSCIAKMKAKLKSTYDKLTGEQ